MSASEIFRKMMAPSFDPADLDKKVDVKTIDMPDVGAAVRVWPRMQQIFDRLFDEAVLMMPRSEEFLR